MLFDHVLILFQSLMIKFGIFKFETSILELPLPLINFFEVSFISLHVHVKSFLPARLKVNEFDDIIGYIT